MSNVKPARKYRVNPRHPVAQGVCDFCGTWQEHPKLNQDMIWQGNSLVWSGFLVCRRCLDVPNEGNRPLFLRADPVPVKYPRPFNFVAAEGFPYGFPPIGQPVDVVPSWDTGGLFWDQNGLDWDMT